LTECFNWLPPELINLNDGREKLISLQRDAKTAAAAAATAATAAATAAAAAVAVTAGGDEGGDGGDDNDAAKEAIKAASAATATTAAASSAAMAAAAAAAAAAVAVYRRRLTRQHERAITEKADVYSLALVSKKVFTRVHIHDCVSFILLNHCPLHI
jgi:hypothetical protein